VERASKAEKLDGSIRVVPEGFSIPTTKEQEWDPNVPPLPCPLLHFMAEREMCRSYFGEQCQDTPR
jgi:hypothetical protein